jgi:hypothetical protein
MHSALPAKVDPRHSLARAGKQRTRQVRRLSREREDGPVVIAVSVAIEESRRARERGADRIEHANVAAL